MIQFSIERKGIVDAIKQLNGQLKVQLRLKKKRLFVECEVFVEPKVICIRLNGMEAYIKSENYKRCSFRMYFSDFTEAIENLTADNFNYLYHFILTEKQIQIEKRKLSILSATINEKEIKYFKEIPLDMINKTDDNYRGVLKENEIEKFCLLSDINKVFTKQKVEKDILTTHAILMRYNVSFKELEELVKSKMYVIDNNLFF